MAFDLVLTGGRVIDPAQGLDAMTSLTLVGGTVTALGSAADPAQATTVRDVSGLIARRG